MSILVKKTAFEPDKLALTKKDILDFCDRVIEKWSKNPPKNPNYILAMNAVKTSVLWTDDESLKAIWGLLIFYMKTHWLKAKMTKQNGQT
jgi:hypothetical protein